MKKIIDLANEYASITVQRKGTQTSYPHLSELDAKFKIWNSLNILKTHVDGKIITWNKKKNTKASVKLVSQTEILF